MAENLVTIATFSSSIEAALARNRLEAEGIPVYLADEGTTTMWSLGGAFAAIKLQVAESNLDRATDILESIQEGDAVPEEQGAASPEAIQPAWTCSRCGSQVSPAASSCPACGTPLDDLEEFSPAPSTAISARRTSAVDDDSVPSLAEDLAARACRASILGLVILPPLLHIYSLSLLIRLAHRPDELSASGMRKMYLALLIDLAALLAGIFLIWLLLP